VGRVLQLGRVVALSRKRVYAAGQLRDRNARDPGSIPDFAVLNLPEELKQIVEVRNGVVLVTGPTGSGKSSHWPRSLI
jgi:Tfp pilus assembly pilus retraction ATPase PilT